ncbi:XdhC family protein [uncultured Vagococcus sp.]|uniref:XdhC family protein n=1 Tax=uncultured Vagococcus sp. TaxID=189676 RepID=UPI0028D0C97D|nr:XdhC family protein [uncultured Vagococcus sp.]
MKDLFELLEKTIRKQESAVLISVIASSGSTPRRTGARMLLTESEASIGTIGGGAIEFRCLQIARDSLKGKRGQLEQFILAPNDVADLGMICGGNAQVLFQFIPATEEMLALCYSVLELISAKRPAWLVAEINPQKTGLSVYSESWLGEAFNDIPVSWIEEGKEKISVAGRDFYMGSLVERDKVFIFGGGHVSQAVVPVLAKLNFHCVVVEDRQDFLSSTLFPEAHELVLADFANINTSIAITSDDYGLVMTRGHLFDYLLQEQLLATPARYIGVMGSQRKIAVQIEKLQGAGFTKKQIQRITMPIGLPIMAETPAELAISIAGQLIMERAK